MRKLLLVVFLLSLTAPLQAQQAQSGIDGFELIAPLKLATGQDNNFLVDRTNPNEKLFLLSLPPSVQTGSPDIQPKKLDDQFLMLTLPKIAYRHNSRRHEFLMTWVPEFEVFLHNSDQNAMNQQAIAGFNYYLRRNIQIWVGDHFQTSKDPALALQNVFLLLPRSPYSENDLQGTVEFQPNQLTNISVQYDTAWTKFGLVDPFQSGILDTRARGYSLTVSRMLSRRQRLSGRYSLFKITPLNKREEFDPVVDARRPFENPVSSFSAEYRMRLNPTTSFGVSSGVIKLNSGTTYTFGGAYSKRIGEFSLGTHFLRGLTYQSQSPAGFAAGLNSYGFYEMLGVRLHGQMTRNTALSLDTTMAHSAADWRVDSSKSLAGQLRFDYRLTDRKVAFASWQTFLQSKNAFLQSSLSRNRFMVGIEISLASDYDRRTSRLNEDSAYVALTDHAARRKALEED